MDDDKSNHGADPESNRQLMDNGHTSSVMRAHYPINNVFFAMQGVSVFWQLP
jgi:hypothetical protein